MLSGGGKQAANKRRCMNITAVNISLDMLWPLCSTISTNWSRDLNFLVSMAFGPYCETDKGEL